MGDKCVIVKESEWQEASAALSNKNYYKNLYNEYYNKYKELSEKHIDNKINVEFGCTLIERNNKGYGSWIRSKQLGYSVIDSMWVSIKGEHISIEGKSKNILYKIKSNVWEKLNKWLKEYVDDEVDRYRKDVNDTIEEKNKLVNKIYKHNRKPWYKRFKKMDID